MAESITSQISFSKLLSHTFPGIFVALGVFMIIDLVIFHDGVEVGLQTTIFGDWKTFLGAVSVLVFLGTIIGVILDSIHHWIEGQIDKTDSAKEFKKNEKEIFRDSNDKPVSNFYFIGFLQLERFQYLIDNYYSYVECELNLSISFLISAFIYGYFLFLHGCDLFKIGVIFGMLIILSGFCLYSGFKNYLDYKKRRVDFIRGALDHLTKI